MHTGRRRALRWLSAVSLLALAGTWSTTSPAATPDSQPAASHDATYGEHGMALFGGKQGLYASHLPMFHAPHDYQVVLRVHVADAAVDRALRQRLDGKTALWTIAPEPFELDRLAPQASRPLRQFKADLVLGHFEQNGKTQYAGATVVVDQVLLFRQLAPQAGTQATAHYLQIGSGTQRFLVKQIDSRPDFDHIVAYTAARGAATDAITIAQQATQQPDASALAAALHVPPASLPGTIYFCTDDLR